MISAKRAQRWLAALLMTGLSPVAVAETVEGRLVPVRTVAIGAHVSGPVVQVAVEAGDRVEEGELLARIDPEPYQARVSAAEARRAQAAAVAEESIKQFQRQEKIYERGLSATHDLEIAQRDAQRDRSAETAAEAEAREARTNLGYTRITAPMDGVVVSRHVESGESVIANLQPPKLFRLAAPFDSLHAELRVSPAAAAGLEVGDELAVTIPALEVERTGTVAVVEPAPRPGSDPPRQRVAVRVDNDDRALQPGLKARVTLP